MWWIAQTTIDPAAATQSGLFGALVFWVIKEQNAVMKAQAVELRKLREAVVLMLVKHDLEMPKDQEGPQ